MLKMVLNDDQGVMFEVPSSSTDDSYVVNYFYDGGWFCNCLDHYFRKHDCKHIIACKNYLKENNMIMGKEGVLHG